MRGLWLAGVAGLVGGMVACSSRESAPDLPMGGFSDGSGDDWADQEYTTYYARFGGSFDLGAGDEPDTEGTGEGGDEGEGEEYAVISDGEGQTLCDWRWSTDAFAGAPLDACVGCDAAWDVTCFDGHQSSGDCTGWMDSSANSGPVQFYLAFEPLEVDGGIEYGMVYVRHSLYDAWQAYAPGKREGRLVSYEFEYELY